MYRGILRLKHSKLTFLPSSVCLNPQAPPRKPNHLPHPDES